MSDWIRLKPGNDWGANYYAITPLTDSGCASHARGIKCVDGEPVPVRWPDGTETTGTIKIVRRLFVVGDMGHDCHGVSDEPHVCASVRGVPVDVRIDAVEVPREWATAHGAK